MTAFEALDIRPPLEVLVSVLLDDGGCRFDSFGRWNNNFLLLLIPFILRTILPPPPAFGAGSGLKGGLGRFLSRLAVLTDLADPFFFFVSPFILEKQVKEKREGGAEVCFFFVV